MPPHPSPPPFLPRLAQHLLATYGHQLDTLTLVLPHPRAAHQLSKHLAQHTPQPTWAPTYHTPHTLLQALGGWHSPPPWELHCHLYTAAQHCHLDTPDDPTTFLLEAPQLHRLLAALDAYLVPVGDLFLGPQEYPHASLSPLQRTAHAQLWAAWQATTPLAQGHFRKQWDTLPALYQRYRHALLAKGLAYPALAYRQLATTLRSQPPSLPTQRIILAGLPPLLPAAVAMVRALATHLPIEVYWDVDPRYLATAQQAVGTFFRAHATDPLLGKHLPKAGTPPHPYPKVTLATAPTHVGQATLAAQRIASLHKEQGEAWQPHRTAILLADTTLLPALWEAWPPHLAPPHLGVGYPLAHLPIASWIRHYLALATAWEGAPTHWRRKASTLCAHPYTAMPATAQATLNTFLAPQGPRWKAWYTTCAPLHRHLLTPPPYTEGAWHHLTTALAHLQEVLLSPAPWEQAALEAVRDLCNRLATRWPSDPPPRFTHALTTLLQRHCATLTLPLPHAPKGGVHVLPWHQGLTLTYDHLILVGANEGTLPAPYTPYQLLPPALATAYGLPTPATAHQEEAYHWYTMLHRTPDLHIIYHQGQAGEARPSRYLLQLQYAGDLAITKQAWQPLATPPTPQPITIAKDDAVMARLDQALGIIPSTGKPRMLTPSALNNYLICPLRFYLAHVAKVPRPPDEAPLSNARFGQLLHKLMETLYRPHVGKRITATTVDTCLAALPALQASLFAAHLPYGEAWRDHGALVIGAAVMQHFVKAFLAKDKAHAPFLLRGVEVGPQEAEGTPFTLDDGTTLHLGGIIDRLDSKGDTLRVIDYKTSAWQGKVADLAGLLAPRQAHPNTTAVQVLWYAWRLGQGHTQGEKVMPVVMSTRPAKSNNTAGTLLLDSTPLHDITAHAATWETQLRKVITAMRDPSQPFVQTPHTHHCQHCPYQRTCQRG